MNYKLFEHFVSCLCHALHFLANKLIRRLTVIKTAILLNQLVNKFPTLYGTLYFIYLGSMVTGDNNVSEEITNCLQVPINCALDEKSY
jgi:hypothetical protein